MNATGLTWDWREQPDLAALAAAVAEVSGGTVRIREYDTGGDQYALIISAREVSDDEAEGVLSGQDVPPAAPDEDPRPYPDGGGTDARLQRWVRDNVTDRGVREGGGGLVSMTGGQLYSILFNLSEYMYNRARADVGDVRPWGSR